jgi:hypothetical protein
MAVSRCVRTITAADAKFQSSTSFRNAQLAAQLGSAVTAAIKGQ